MFNKTIIEGFPTSWTEHIISPIFKGRDPMIPRNYRTIVVDHYLAKLHGSILESKSSVWVERKTERYINVF